MFAILFISFPSLHVHFGSDEVPPWLWHKFSSLVWLFWLMTQEYAFSSVALFIFLWLTRAFGFKWANNGCYAELLLLFPISHIQHHLIMLIFGMYHLLNLTDNAHTQDCNSCRHSKHEWNNLRLLHRTVTWMQISSLKNFSEYMVPSEG